MRDRTIPRTEATFSLLEWMLIISCFFPYVRIVPLPMDVQPYALLFSIVVLFFKGLKAKPYQWAMALIPLVGILLILVSNNKGAAVRSFGGYLSIFLIPLAVVALFSRRKLPESAFKYFIYVWLIFALIQFFIKRDFGSFLFPTARTSESRGVTSLSNEPSFYGQMCIFFLVIDYILYNNWKTQLLLAFQVVVLAQSSMIVLVLMGFLFLRVWFERPATRLPVLVALFIIYNLLMQFILSLFTGRLRSVLSRLLEDPFRLILVDKSINDRVFSIVFSFVGSLRNFLLPVGIDRWDETVIDLFAVFPSARTVNFSRILSGIGSIVFELGFVGLIFPITMIASILLMKIPKAKRFMLVVFFPMNLLLAIPLAHGTLGFILGLFYVFGQIDRTIEDEARA